MHDGTLAIPVNYHGDTLPTQETTVEPNGEVPTSPILFIQLYLSLSYKKLETSYANISLAIVAHHQPYTYYSTVELPKLLLDDLLSYHTDITLVTVDTVILAQSILFPSLSRPRCAISLTVTSQAVGTIAENSTSHD